ncbi:hypothetical protein [Streptomyces sp. DSM 41013]
MSGDDRGSLLRRGRDHRTVRRETEHLAPAPVEVVTVDALPAPYDAADNRPAHLDDQERATLEACERALSGLQRAYITAGKALEVISRGRLYRETHSSFNAYVSEVWGFQRAHAYRWIAEWRLGAELSKVSPRGDTSAVPETHARAALPVAKAHGDAVAVASFQETAALADRYGAKLTTPRVEAVMRAVAEQAPTTPEEARTAVRAVVAAGLVPGLAPAAVPSQDAREETGEDDGQDQTAEETDQQARAFAVLGALRKDVVRMPGALLEYGPPAFLHESAEVEAIVRDVVQAMDLGAHRGRTLLRARGVAVPPGDRMRSLLDALAADARDAEGMPAERRAELLALLTRAEELVTEPGQS